PFEERRTNAIRHRSWLDPAETQAYSTLDQAAIDQVREEAWPLVRNVDEMHDALYSLGFVTQAEVERHRYGELLQQLSDRGRACRLVPVAVDEELQLWVAAERLPCLLALYPAAQCVPTLELPQVLQDETWDEDAALRET